MPPLPPYEQAFIRRQAAISRRILQHYEDGITFLSPTLNSIKYNGKPFRLADYPLLKKRVDQMAGKLQNQVYTTTVNGIKDSWDFSNKKNDVLVDKRLAGSRIKKKARQALYDPNDAALKQFIERKEKGLNLSKRVWKAVDPFKKEIEQSIGIGIGKGESAAEMTRELRKNLLEPERLFRRVRGEDGRLHLSAAARAFHPGQGVYRSSFKNALRLTRSENNMAYRTADHERWKTLPFVTGIEIKLSSAHPKVDICDHLMGKYPKDFKFSGWHPQCICFAVPEMMNDDEYDKLENQILAGEPVTVPAAQLTKAPPAAFGKYLSDNKEMLARLKSEPYWMRDNKQYLSSGTMAPAASGESRPIGAQFTKTIPKPIRNSVKHALESIDKVHSDGELDDIPFVKSDSVSSNGVFYANRYTGKAEKIALSVNAPAPEITVAHEMGHYLDAYSIGKKNSFGSRQKDSPAWKVVEAAKETESIKKIESILEAGTIFRDGADQILSEWLEDHLKYLLQPHEIFARSYAQYIAQKSGSSVMKSALEKAIGMDANKGYLHQWSETDFKKIAEAMDEMMVELGWVVSL